VIATPFQGEPIGGVRASRVVLAMQQRTRIDGENAGVPRTTRTRAGEHDANTTPAYGEPCTVDSAHQSFQLANGGPTIDYGSWAALDVKTGRVIWQVADPTPGTIDPGAVSVANGVMYAGSYSGAMYALNAATGAVLFGLASGGSVIDAPSIVNGTVFWGSGYRHLAPGTGNNSLRVRGEVVASMATRYFCTTMAPPPLDGTTESAMR
jgi:outer membrane protein assembly factor BamB